MPFEAPARSTIAMVTGTITTVPDITDRNMPGWRRLVPIMTILAALWQATGTGAATYSNLHSCVGTAGDGIFPTAALSWDGTNLYGMAKGSVSHNGTIFRLQPDGSAFTNLHIFTGSSTNGAQPYGSLLLAGATFYGMTTDGGTSDGGVLFKINTDGTAYSNLFLFTTAASGTDPYGSLITDGAYLYGMTFTSGSVFRIGFDGSGFTNLHRFTGGADGTRSDGTPILLGNVLYGMTQQGGAFNAGTIFRIGVDGSDYSVLHDFAGSTVTNGKYPYYSQLLPLHGALYGLTSRGGSNETGGVVFRVNPDGSGYTNLHWFNGTDGRMPFGFPIHFHNRLYGTAGFGGTADLGMVFRQGIDGQGFTNLYSFTGGMGGESPYAGLLQVGSRLYGVTQNGGSGNQGVIFALDIGSELYGDAPLRICNLGTDTNDIILCITNLVPGDAYAIDAHTNLDTQDWDVATNFNAAVEVQNAPAMPMEKPARFYRVRRR